MFKILQQKIQFSLPFCRCRTFLPLNKCPVKQLHRALWQKLVNTVWMRCLIAVTPHTVGIMVLFYSLLYGKRAVRIFFRHAGKRMDAVIQQLENNHRQSKFILLFAHILTGLGHSFGINIFLADKFRRKPRLFALNRKTVAVKHGHRHRFFVNRNVRRFQINDIMPVFMQ